MVVFAFISLLAAYAATAGGYGDHPAGMNGSGGSISLESPKQGQSFDDGSNIQLKYVLNRSINGNHLHLYIDDGDPIIIRKVIGCPCTFELPELSTGKHRISVKEATASHALTGVESSVTFEVE